MNRKIRKTEANRANCVSRTNHNSKPVKVARKEQKKPTKCFYCRSIFKINKTCYFTVENCKRSAELVSSVEMDKILLLFRRR